MRALGFRYDRIELRELMKKADRDNSGTVELDEFKALMAGLMKERDTEDELAKVFKFYDDDEGKTIDIENLK